jgi:hypothetical protein
MEYIVISTTTALILAIIAIAIRCSYVYGYKANLEKIEERTEAVLESFEESEEKGKEMLENIRKKKALATVIPNGTVPVSDRLVVRNDNHHRGFFLTSSGWWKACRIDVEGTEVYFQHHDGANWQHA